MSPRATETKNGASVLGISNQYDLVISLELVPFPQTSEVDCGQPQSLHQYTSTVCTQSAQNILNRQLFMLHAHKLFIFKKCIDWGGKSIFQTWAPYQVQCPCLKCQHQLCWILLTFPSLGMGTKTLRIFSYPIQWVNDKKEMK